MRPRPPVHRCDQDQQGRWRGQWRERLALGHRVRDDGAKAEAGAGRPAAQCGGANGGVFGATGESSDDAERRCGPVGGRVDLEQEPADQPEQQRTDGGELDLERGS